ncbi:hypothetical protein HanRHA438_Chr03g0128471 [Helianthus annuus]|nr:hypothetical protein HanRHA438_Chr03g0128471 [Helianthus annuus]
MFHMLAHSSIDDSLACWFSLNQLIYRWALDDYYGKGTVVSEILQRVQILQVGWIG